MSFGFGPRVLLIALLQTVLLGGMVAAKQWTLATGTAVVLDVVPVDPRALFSGDYVNLRYAISRLEPARLGGDDDFRAGDALHVVLRRDGETWRARSVHHAAPEHAADTVVIRGQVVHVSGDTVLARYGIESFYIPEGKGRELEKLARDSRLSVEAVVDGSGDAVIAALLIDGKDAYREPLF